MNRSQNTDTLNKSKDDHNVVILGTGYGGMHACRTLMRSMRKRDDISITVISPVDHFLYVTMLYEVAVGNLAPSSIRQSVRVMTAAENASFRQGAATNIDVQNQTVTFTVPDTEHDDTTIEQTISYDYCISAIGSETSFYGTPGADKHALTLKTLPDARTIKNTLINRFEQASRTTDKKHQKRLLSTIVVGGGATGATLTAKIADLLNDELADAFPDLANTAQVTLIEGNDSLVENAGPWFSRRVTKAVKDKPHVRVITGRCVQKVRPDGVECKDDFLPSQCVIWTAGVKARDITIDNADYVARDESTGRVYVNRKLHLPNQENVFVVGDQAWVERPGSDDPYPMRAQFAVRQGRQAARNVLAQIRGQQMAEFDWADKGLVVSAGHGKTFADVFGIKMSGLPATIAYKSVYLMSTIGIRNKLRAVLEWVMNIFLPRDISEL